MKGALGVRPTDVLVLPVRATATTTVVQEISIADVPESMSPFSLILFALVKPP